MDQRTTSSDAEPPAGASPGRRPTVVFILLILVPLAAGLLPRFWNLGAQVLGDDELHAVRTALSKPVSDIWFYYQPNDHCIPLTVWYRLLIDQGVVMTEWDFRLPVLVSGLLALILIPMAIRQRLGDRPAVLLAWLLALSPAMVFYTRIARSYMPIVLLGFAAVMAFEAWWRGRGRRWGAFYAVLSAAAVYLHLGAGPFVCSPFLFALGDLARLRRVRRETGPGLPALAGLGLAFTTAAALFLVPARKTLGLLISAKHGEQASIPLSYLPDVFNLQAGTGSAALTILFWITALAGLLLLLRHTPRFGWYSLVLAAGHLAGLIILSPYAMEVPIILNRYLLPVLPFVLVWAAAALAHPWARDHRWRFLQWGLVTLFLLALVIGGPFAGREIRSSSFAHHNDFLWFTRPLAQAPESAVPPFYRQLADTGESQPVLEYPWTTNWPHGQIFYVYQSIHRQEVLVAAQENVLNDPRLAFRNMPRADARSILASRARFLVVHLKLSVEESVVMLEGRRTRPMPENLHDRFNGSGQRLAAKLRRSWGPPLYADQRIEVWDLEPIRTRLR